jgi:LPXTG-site transpeptidase (sortase) family protein
VRRLGPDGTPVTRDTAAGPSRRRAVAGLVIGILLVTAPVALRLSTGPGYGGYSGPVLAPSAQASEPVAPATVSARPPPSAPDAVAPAVPVRIRLPDFDVDVPVVPVGVDGHGEMAVPEDVRTVGWYRYGPGPGSTAGSSVLAGHVDDRLQGHGAFYRLAELAENDAVIVDLADGTQLRYRVRAVERVAKSELPVDRLFARDGSPRLTLVTCGGDFDQATRRYRQNVVVFAETEGGAQ